MRILSLIFFIVIPPGLEGERYFEIMADSKRILSCRWLQPTDRRSSEMGGL
jgi:hypothetical protein